MFKKELMLIRQVNPKSVILKGLSFNHMYAIDSMIY